MFDRLDDLLARPVGTRSIAVVRMIAGVVAAALLWPVALDALEGDTFHDRFHHPFFDLVPVLSPGWYTAMAVVGSITAIMLAIGLVTRTSAAATTAVFGYFLLVSTTHLHNNRAYLFAVLVCVSLAPAGRSWSIDRLVRRWRGSAPLPETMSAWPLWLLRFESALIYAASGLSKLVDPDWFGGTVTWGRVMTQEAIVRASMLPEFVQDVLLDRSFHTVAAKVVVLTELAIAVGLWWPRSRPWAVAVAVSFHVAIEVSAEVQTFSYLAIGVLVVWADPGLQMPSPLRRFRRVTA